MKWDVTQPTRPLTTSSRATSWWHSRRPTACACAATIFAGTRSSRRGWRPMRRPPRRRRWPPARKPHQHRGDPFRGAGIRVGRGERSLQRSQRTALPPCAIPFGTISPASGRPAPGISRKRSSGRTQPTPMRCCFITTTTSRSRAPSSTPFSAWFRICGDGVPINGVGFEMHVLNTTIRAPPNWRRTCKRWRRSACRYTSPKWMSACRWIPAATPRRRILQTQAQIYQTVLTVCLQQPNCTAFQVWGVSYNDSWIPAFPRIWRGAAIRFQLCNPTPAFYSLMTAMQTSTTPPVLNANSVVNAASYQGGPVAPGEIVAIFDANYGPPAWCAARWTDRQIPDQRERRASAFDGVPAPLIYASANRWAPLCPLKWRASSRRRSSINTTLATETWSRTP
jgi:hypothetical protein